MKLAWLTLRIDPYLCTAHAPSLSPLHVISLPPLSQIQSGMRLRSI
jgi:hypothetical protein